ncbi:uncharacterized protein [Drosophila tropicalis]|uniref:uncharacterized protein n=1 Tax=Drosophila tropicalis TaxID=46794 RepID=UPI0035AC1C4F
MLGSLQAERLNNQNSSTSYYNFLTSDRQCLESWNCGGKKFIDTPPKDIPIPPPTLNNLIKYYDMDDKAIEWYMGTIKKPLLKPCTKKFCYKFRVPIRHVAKRMMRRPELPFYQGRRISPEFFCLLQKYQQKLNKKSRIYQLPRKMLTGKPSFSYYKYDAANKSRHMRPGIDTAAPVEFPCKNMSCPRRTLTPDEIEKLNGDQFLCCAREAKPKSTEPLNVRAVYDPHCQYSKDISSKHVLPDSKKKCENCAALYLEKNALVNDLEKEKTADMRYRLHEIYDPNCEFNNDRVKREGISDDKMPRRLHLLYDANPERKQISLKDSREKLHQIFVASRNDVPAKETPRKVSPAPDMTDYCPITKPKVKLGPCEKLICPKRPKCPRDPRSIEFENRPLSKILRESDRKRKSCSSRQRCRRNGSRSTSVATTTEDDDAWNMRNWTKSLEKDHQQEQAENACYGYRVRPASNGFYNEVAGCPQRVLAQRSKRPDLYEQNDVEMPPKRKLNRCGYGYTGFIHHSENRKLNGRCHKVIRGQCKRKKPPPYCYFWSAVDPDIRHEERTRLAEIDCRNRHLCKTRRPYTYYWSKVPYGTRNEAKRRLAESQAPVVERQKRRAPRLFWSKENRVLQPGTNGKRKKRHGSITSQSSQRSSQLSTNDSKENVALTQSKPTFKGNHAKQHSSYYYWSTNKQRDLHSKPPSQKTLKDDDSSSECACSEDQAVLRSSYLSTARNECHPTELQMKRKSRTIMDRKAYASDRENDKEVEHMWSGLIQPKQRPPTVSSSNPKVIKKPRILPNLQAVVKNFFWSSKKSKKSYAGE